MNPSSEVNVDTQKKKGGRPKGSKAQGSGEWKPVFLAALQAMPVVRVACQKAGISRSEAYKVRSTDAVFALAWKQALQDGIDMVEATLHVRARKNDTTAAIFLLKNLRPEVYSENLNVNVNGSVSIEEVQGARPSLHSKLVQIASVVAPGARRITLDD